jgi:hypothetical protein
MKTKILRVFSSIFFAFIFICGFGQNQAPQIKEATEPDWSNPTGPYKVLMEVDETLPDHTVYRPADLSAFPGKDELPVVTFTGPGCNFDGTSFRPFYTEIASHGFLVIVTGLPWKEYSEIMGHPRVTGKDTKASLDWAFAENSRAGSKYFGKIDLSNIGVMGQSCGGIMALGLMDDKRITLLTLWNSGMFDGSNSMTSDSPLTGTREDLKLLTTPIGYFNGGTDMARPNAAGDFEVINNVPVFLAVRSIEGDAHGGTFREKNGGGFGTAGAAWVMWNMKGDKKAASMFTGNPCGLAQDTAWIEIRKKNID